MSTQSTDPAIESPQELPYSMLLPRWLRVSDIYLKCQQRLQRDLRELDLSLAQHDVLAGIHANPGLTQRELADVLYVVKSNVTSLLKKLEAQKLVVRTPDHLDARVNRLSLTADGEALVIRSLAVQRRIVSAMLGHFSADELAMLEVMMERVGAALDELAPAAESTSAANN